MSEEFKNRSCAPSDCASCGLDCGSTSPENHNTITQNQNGEVYLYKFSRTEKGDPVLANIESDDEYAKAAEAFDIVLDNARKAEAAGEPLE